MSMRINASGTVRGDQIHVNGRWHTITRKDMERDALKVTLYLDNGERLDLQGSSIVEVGDKVSEGTHTGWGSDI